jgi:hypothetical protein
MSVRTSSSDNGWRLIVGFVVAVAAIASPAVAAAQQTAGVTAPPGSAPAAAPAANQAAPIDLTGYWVSIVTEEWRWRMLTPPKGDYSSVPLNQEGRKVTDAWDLAKDEQRGEACKPFGVGNIMRMPGRVHVTWPDDKTLKLEFDAGTQIRLLHIGATRPARLKPTWQGYSAAVWESAAPTPTDRQNQPTAGGQYRLPDNGGGGSLRVVTTNMRDGYLRKNGVPYSAGAVITEYFDRVEEPNGDVMLLVRTVVDDPTYLTEPFITSTFFKREPDGSKWHPTPCKADPPAVPPLPLP